MERCLGWRGVLVEPNPRPFGSEARSRTLDAGPRIAMCRGSRFDEPASVHVGQDGPGARGAACAVPVPCVSLTDILLRAGHRK